MVSAAALTFVFETLPIVQVDFPKALEALYQDYCSQIAE